MNASETLFLLLGVIALLGGGYYLYTQQPVQQAQSIPSLTWDAPTAGRVDDALSFSVDITNAPGSTVTFVADGATSNGDCSTNPCRLAFMHTFSRPGLHTVGVRVNDYTFTRIVSVTDTIVRCIDGTRDKACAAPPLQCVNGKFVDNCSICGCPTGETCQSNQCVSEALSFGIGTMTSTLRGSHAQIGVPLQNHSTTSVDGLFLVYVDVYDNTDALLSSFPQQVRLDDVAPGVTRTIASDVQLPARAARIGGRIYSVTPEGNPVALLGSTTQTVPLAIAFDNVSPSAPGNLRVVHEDDVGILRWDASASQDVSGYVVYRQNFDSQQFTTYSVLAETTATQYVLPVSGESLLYTVRAKDFSGNLSEPAQAVMASGNAT
ncbi:MAG: fibronectin type III domain-containing protein [Candidatus Iainarchaeum archaeon]|uniref:Fibronectin type III domain-containing protein n=1 Tax=Candidatus Iainarchaeum sp. TaxID=3101447 RepID=A0A7T9DK53_9ARCH|nr:MAG: fibronectin type III domain-containing protein [Candidatus Diapherotrites archaeon]